MAFADQLKKALYRLHLLQSIARAERDGFHHFAKGLRAVYGWVFGEDAP